MGFGLALGSKKNAEKIRKSIFRVSGGLIGSTIIANPIPSHFVRDDASLLDNSVVTLTVY